ncbi:I78 family peptidase inhibitor [Ramlibacter sp. WS9]|uniref:I78 family peptidase inhibitor n=1 Tax=Ramlibacter sp. WS9 TaxID=1882741 RepID=UPI0011418E32|nr:I78 family peptidase inhibitor [Ramlibacter sp. WS9]ROZ76708.1 starvation-inducible protein [Ramlibacter sp. WS9]
MPQPLRLCLPLALFTTLSACAQQPPQVPAAPRPPVIAPNECNDAAAQFAVGKIADAKLAEEARVRASALRVRMVRPGQMVTMEFDASRLTIEVDAGGKVASVRCG